MGPITKFIQKLSSRQFMFTIINILGLSIITYILYATKSVWIGWLNLLIRIIKPFFYGFTIAYVFEPFIKTLERFHIKRIIGISLIMLSLIVVFLTFIGTLFPLLYQNSYELADTFTYGIKEIEEIFLTSFKIDLSSLTQLISLKISHFLQPDYVLNTSLNFMTQALSFIGNGIIYLILSIYFLIDYTHVKNKIKHIAISIHPQCPHYLKCIDQQLTQYIKAFITLMIIQGVMYGLMYGLLGHPNWLVLGLLAGFSGIFPYFGPLIANLFGFITTLGLGNIKVLILIIMICLFSNLDSYYITPKIYSKKIQIEPIWVIFGILTGSTLFGALGVVIAMPILVIIKISYQTYKNNHS